MQNMNDESKLIFGLHKYKTVKEVRDQYPAYYEWLSTLNICEDNGVVKMGESDRFTFGIHRGERFQDIAVKYPECYNKIAGYRTKDGRPKFAYALNQMRPFLPAEFVRHE